MEKVCVLFRDMLFSWDIFPRYVVITEPGEDKEEQNPGKTEDGPQGKRIS